MGINKTVKFGIISDSLMLKSWEAECIKQASNLNGVTLELIILPSKEISARKTGLIHRLTSFRISKIFFHIYIKLFINPKCYSKIDMVEDFKAVDKVFWSGNRLKISIESFSENDLIKIKKKELDFIISFSELADVDAKILDIPKHGIWAFHHDDEEKYRGNVHCFWEIYHDDPVNGAILKKLTHYKNKYIVIKKGFFKTVNYSLKKNLDNVHLCSIHWVKEACIDLLKGNAEWIKGLPTKSKASVFGEPNNLDFLVFYLRILKNRCLAAYRSLFFLEQWNIGYIENTFDELLNKKNDNLRPIWLFPPSRNWSYADPFPLKWKNKTYIFFECLGLYKRKGEIHSLIFNPVNKGHENRNVCISRPVHISYPFVFYYEGGIYLVPETCRSNEVALFKSTEFPFVWEKKAVLLEGVDASDSTIFKHNGYFWLFCTMGKGRWNHELNIFFAEDLFGPWYPHEKNPVKVDIRSSRPGGRVIKHGNLLIRPSQDCSLLYGRKIVLNKINRLSPFEFEEEPIKVIEPFKGSGYEMGIHTINIVDDIIIIDGRRDIFSVKKLLIRISKRIKPIDFT